MMMIRRDETRRDETTVMYLFTNLNIDSKISHFTFNYNYPWLNADFLTCPFVAKVV